MSDAPSKEHGVPAETPQAKRNLTEIVVAAVAGAVANPVVADAYEGTKGMIKKGVDKIRDRAPDAGTTGDS
jgi:hypothetical protein